MSAYMILAVAAPLLIAGCGTNPADAGGPVAVSVALKGSGTNAGEVGRTTLLARRGGTDITIVVSGVPPGTTRPVHLYASLHRGSCGALEEPAEHALTERVLAETWRNGPYTVRAAIAVPLARLRASARAIVVRNAPADGAQLLYCGNLT